ncbi:MAG TPA: dihydrolipoyl dehydrogenase [Polyangiaceae bacterium]|mgnify:CR=1 FL=1|nr:dihydrolipoyl dehydrogenase [Polyangiaceae bacterium]
MDTFDLVVLGAGPGGYVCAIRASQLGLKTAIVEKEPSLGGTCLNVGCIPSKALLESSELLHVARSELAAHGISTGPVAFDLSKMMERKRGIVSQLTDGIGMLMKKNKVEVVRGRGVLQGSGNVSVHTSEGVRKLESKAICLAMGSVPVELPFLKFDGTHVVSSTEALSFEAIPKHLVVVGAGAVGLELGSVWSRLGAKVTVIEMLPTITPFADEQAAKTLKKSLEAQGLDIRLETKVKGAVIDGGQVHVSFETKEGNAETIVCDRVLVSVGRKPCVDTAGLAEAGVRLEQGKVWIDERFQTTLPHVYAIGDLVRGPMLAHKASEEGVAVAEIVAGKPATIQYDLIPNVVYTHPELAQVGLTEQQAKQQGIAYKVEVFLPGEWTGKKSWSGGWVCQNPCRPHHRSRDWRAYRGSASFGTHWRVGARHGVSHGGGRHRENRPCASIPG